MLCVYNTLTNRKETFIPIEPGKIRLYVCGMTVYDYCHVGHARVMVTFDVITRYLRYRGYEVDYVRNITDVDDKIIQRARDNDESCEALTQRFIKAMHEDEWSLGVQPPSMEPKATAHIQAIINMVQILLDKGYAYLATNHDVYYRVERFADYGQLSNRKLDDLRAGIRVDIGAAKDNPLDFVLWKAAKSGEISWNSPWGLGRPGWHIECSAMSKCCLGNHFDIHGGGPDLPFPHHENEIAQSEAANDSKFVNYWLHAGAVRVNQEKMSKSLGNFFTIREVLARHSAEHVRYMLTASQYRSQIDYSESSLAEAHAALQRFYLALQGLQLNDDIAVTPVYEQRFQAAMDDDFNTREALAVLFDMAREINRFKSVNHAAASQLASQLCKLAGVLGLLQSNADDFLCGSSTAGDLDEGSIVAKVQQRTAAKQAQDFVRADQIRAWLQERGVVLEDSRDGTRWRRKR